MISMTCGSASQVAIDTPIAVRSMRAPRERASIRTGSAPIGYPASGAGQDRPAQRGRVRDAEKVLVQQGFTVVAVGDRKTGSGVVRTALTMACALPTSPCSS